MLEPTTLGKEPRLSAKIKDRMIQRPVTLRQEQSLFSARELMVVHEYECLFVVDKEQMPVGIVTSVRISGGDPKKTVGSVLTPEFPRLSPEDSLQEAAKIFLDEDKHNMAMAVVDEAGKLVGVLRLRDIVKELGAGPEAPPAEGHLSPESAALYLSMTRTPAKEKEWLERIRSKGLRPGVTQVGANAEKLPIKLRESGIVAAIAYQVIPEEERSKNAVSRAVGTIIQQMRLVSPGLGGGYKLGIVRGEGRIAVAAFGRSGHSLANSAEQSFLGSCIL